MDKKELFEIFNSYGFNMEQYVGMRNISIGHINTTNILYFDQGEKVKRYLLQKININVFKNPDELMENIENVSIYGKRLLKSFEVDNYKNKIIRIFLTKNRKTFMKTSSNNYYRIYHYVEGSISFDVTTDPELLENAGKAIGFFQNLLASFPIEKLYETIPHFHDTPYRLNHFKDVVKEANPNIVSTCEKEIEFVINHEDIAYFIQPLIDKKEMPLKVTHNDTKINNIMFDYATKKPLCLVDLDTIMPGSICYDFGDFVRSACNLGQEDEQDLNKVIFSEELFSYFAKGYLYSVASSIENIELDNLVKGAILMTYECGMRFLTDYLEGNVYFKVNYPTHNLIRARTQFHLVKQMLAKQQELENEIKEIYKTI